MQKYAIIVAGGAGRRFGADLPKQFVLLEGKPILLHTLETFYRYSTDLKIVLVLPQEQIRMWNDICTQYGVDIPHETVAGGSERFFSVKNGLCLVPNAALVAIHDGVRPFVNLDVIDRAFTSAETNGVAVPVIPLNESIRLCQDNKNTAFDRNKIKIVQTPQVFLSTLLKEAYNQPFSENFTDDASVVEAMGKKISFVEGNVENIKITTQFDLAVGKAIIIKQTENK